MPASGIDEEEARPASEVAPTELGEWDISMCFAAAKKLGVESDAYTHYLLGVYAVDVDNVPTSALAEQQGILEKALADPEAGKSLAEVIRSVGQKVQKRNGKQSSML